MIARPTPRLRELSVFNGGSLSLGKGSRFFMLCGDSTFLKGKTVAGRLFSKIEKMLMNVLGPLD